MLIGAIFILNQGVINGKQIVPKEVIKIATSLQSPTYVNKELPQNGLFWFVQNEPAQLSELGERVPKGSYQILGITGPTILVIPEYNVVVAKCITKDITTAVIITYIIYVNLVI